MFHKAGHNILLVALVVSIVLVLLSDTALANSPWLELFQLLIIFGLASVMFFFRNPKRSINPNSETIVAPIDGTITSIETVEVSQLANRCVKIRIANGFWQPHGLRYPVSGTLVASEYHPEPNEHYSVIIANPTLGKILHKQFAGSFRQGILNNAQTQQSVVQGRDAGFTKFGSSVDLYVPLDRKLNVSLHQKVKAGITLIAD